MSKKTYVPSPLLLAACDATWQAIGSDAGEVEDNECAIELCLDADRMETFGGENGKAANEELKAACKEFGWSVVARAVAKARNYA